MHWLIYVVFANLTIFVLEYVYRTDYFNGFWGSLYITIIPILTMQFCLYKAFSTGTSLLVVGASFTAMNGVLRLINAYAVGEPPSLLSYAGIALLLAGVFVLSYDKSLIT